jgi:hypothetical protein
VVRAQGAVHALVVAHDRRVALGVGPRVAQRLALLVHRCVVLGVVHALRERAMALVLGGLTLQLALVQRRQVH